MDNTGRANLLVAAFPSAQEARNAVAELRREGLREDQIGIVAHGDVATDGPQVTQANKAEEGAVAGAGAGGLWAIGIAAGLLPAVGPVVAGGLLASVLASTALGAAAGGLIGGLIGLGVPEEEARYYEEEFRAGRSVLVVRPEPNQFDAVVAILDRHGAYQRYGRVNVRNGGTQV